MKQIALLLSIILILLSVKTKAENWKNYYGNDVSALENDGNYLWIGNASLFIRFNKSTLQNEIFDLAKLNITQSIITSIKLDHAGNKWIGTYSDGVILYNGTTFTKYTTANSSLPSNFIRDIAFSNDTLFVATSNGLFIHFGNTNVTLNTNNTAISNNSITKIAIDKNNNKWIGTEDGLFVFNNISMIAKTIPKYFNNNILAISFEDDTAWVSSNDYSYSTLAKFSLSNINAPYLDTINLYVYLDGIAVNSQHQKIITKNGCILKFDGKNTFNQFDTISGFSGNSISSIVVDTGNIIWLASKRLYKYDGTNLQCYNVTNSSLISSATHIVELELDKNGKLWIGTELSGLSTFNGRDWHTYTNNETHLNQINQGFNTIGFSNDNKVWAGAEYGSRKLVAFDNNQWNYYDNIASVADMQQDSSGKLYFINQWDTLGIYFYQNNQWNKYTNYDANPALGHWALTDIDQMQLDFKPNDSTIWLGGNATNGIGQGLGLIKLNNQHSVRYTSQNSPLPSDAITSIAKDRTGNIWICTLGGLAKFDGTNWSIYNNNNSPIPNSSANYLQCVTIDNNNAIWVGTRESGLMKYSGSQWTVFNTSNSMLPTNDVRKIKVDKFNNLWIGTSNGLCTFNEAGITNILADSSSDNFSISGIVFFDKNNDGIKNTDEPLMANQKVVLLPDSIISYTDNLGLFYFSKPNGNYTINLLIDSNYVATTNNLPYIIQINNNNQTNLSFGIKPLTNIDSISFSLTSGFTRCNTTVPFWINYGNQGTSFVNGRIYLVIDSSCTFNSSFPTATSVNNDTLFWTINNLAPFENHMITVLVDIPSPYSQNDTIAKQDSLVFSSRFLSSIKQFNQTINGVIKCSFDPNDKLVNPIGEHKDSLSLLSNPLEYTIRFQNTGNDTAFLVTIYDTISTNLEMKTFRIISSSHNVQTFMTGNSIKFIFSNVQIPDSNVNEPMSHGYIKYYIEPKKGLLPQTEILNKAYIIFDRNVPIITNTVKTILVTSIPQDITSFVKANARNNNLDIYPNPSNGTFNIKLNTSDDGLIKIKLFDITGKIVYQNQQQSKPIINIITKNISNGFYNLLIQTDKEQFINKIIIENK